LSYSFEPMGALSEWLKIMLGEVTRKHDEALRDAAEEKRRADAPQPTPPPDTPRAK
jgi:hypothetical protein